MEATCISFPIPPSHLSVSRGNQDSNFCINHSFAFKINSITYVWLPKRMSVFLVLYIFEMYKNDITIYNSSVNYFFHQYASMIHLYFYI